MIYIDYDGNKTYDIEDAKYLVIESSNDYELAKIHCNELELHFSGYKFGVYEIDLQSDRLKLNELLTNIYKIGQSEG